MLIAEFAKATGLGRDTVRFYIKRGLLTPQVGVSGTNRYQSFDAQQVERALVIREAQSLGFTLREIGTLSDEYERVGMTLARKAELMRERLAEVDEQAAKLKRLRRYFAAKLEWLEAGAEGEPPAFLKPKDGGRRSACMPISTAKPTERLPAGSTAESKTTRGRSVRS